MSICELLERGLLRSRRDYAALSRLADSLLEQINCIRSGRGARGFPIPLSANEILNPPGRGLFLLASALVAVNVLINKPQPTCLFHRYRRTTSFAENSLPSVLCAPQCVSNGNAHRSPMDDDSRIWRSIAAIDGLLFVTGRQPPRAEFGRLANQRLIID